MSSGGYYNFFVQDSYNGAGSNFNYSTSSYDGESGDYIIERASPPVTALANFYYVNFLNDYANGSGSGNTINHYPYTDIRMTSNGGSGGTDLAHVTQSVNSNGGFQVHYYNCQ